MRHGDAEPVRAIYVHVPFCHTICGYCDFFSVVYERREVAPLVDALLSEIDEARRRWPICAETVFVGGGTPTTLPADELRRLLRAVRELAGPELELTVEANPATVTPRVAEVLAEQGVTRVSVGAQSFDGGELRVLERIHEPAQVPQTVRTCRAAGIPQVNVDLIFGVPGQSLASWQHNLAQAIELGVDHLSCYGLTYEKGTPLHEQLRAGQVRRVPAGREARMYETTIDTLADAGFAQYEISNFARPGCECRHNLVYWHNRPYVGVGPSAAGYVDGVRYRNVPDLAAYVRAVQAGRSPVIEQERRSRDQEARETAMLELRLREGVDVRRFAERFGSDPRELFAEAIERHTRLGLLDVCETRIRLTRAGLLVADSVIADFL